MYTYTYRTYDADGDGDDEEAKKWKIESVIFNRIVNAINNFRDVHLRKKIRRRDVNTKYERQKKTKEKRI